MYRRPQPRVLGETKAFIQGIYDALLEQGYPHPSVQSMSLSRAMLHAFGSDVAVDEFLGFGIFSGIKCPISDVAQWRKVWSRVKEEQKTLYLAQEARREAALEALADAFDECLAAGVTTEAMHDVFGEAICRKFRGLFPDAA